MKPKSAEYCVKTQMRPYLTQEFVNATQVGTVCPLMQITMITEWSAAMSAHIDLRNIIIREMPVPLAITFSHQ